ncbi:DUF2125 domain-containing protein [uncultured Roseobacter sp.]|uniref:DUF2125 domain-containing protein n=1 Tax=uncultured Roseobacter sp. TaxID=114847 RepID=UPI0026042E2C|nr:DUF2125 domain-containing protein [uncultured Roseobacter sp.]
MRRIVWFLLIAGVAWSAWWGVTAFGMRSGILTWFEERRAEGWQAELNDVELGGWPLAINAELEEPALADPETGAAFFTRSLTLSAATWWPGYVTLRLPDDGVTLASPEASALLITAGAQARLRLRPGPALQLESMEADADSWGVTSDPGDLASGGPLIASLVQNPDDPRAYTLRFDASALRPGSVLRDALFVPEDWPVTFDVLTVDADIAFDRPWDVSALEDARPQPRHIQLERAEAVWGDLQVRFAADLDVDAGGVPEGTLSVQVRNWRDIIALAERAGSLPAALVPQITRTLETFAGLSGNPSALDVELSLSNGLISLGFIPVAPAPRLILR